MNIGTASLAIVLFLATALFLGFLLSYPFMLLWNGCLVGAVAGVNELTWLQSWGVLILCNVMFKTSLSTKT